MTAPWSKIASTIRRGDRFLIPYEWVHQLTLAGRRSGNPLSYRRSLTSRDYAEIGTKGEFGRGYRHAATQSSALQG